MTLYYILNLVSDWIQNNVNWTHYYSRCVWAGICYFQYYKHLYFLVCILYSIYTIYTAPFPTLARGWRSITVFLSRIFAHVRGVEGNIEKIKNVITSIKIKLMTWNLVWASFISIWWNQYNKNLNFRYTSWVSEFSHFRRGR